MNKELVEYSLQYVGHDGKTLATEVIKEHGFDNARLHAEKVFDRKIVSLPGPSDLNGNGTVVVFLRDSVKKILISVRNENHTL